MFHCQPLQHLVLYIKNCMQRRIIKKKPENNKIYKENRKNKMSLVKDHQKPLQMIHKHENVSLVFKKLSNI